MTTMLATSAKPSSEATALIEEIHRLKAEVGCSLWKMGRALQQLHDQPEWWKPYGSWDKFTTKEIKLTGGYCYRLIDVAKEFSEKQAIECGTANLIRILPVPKGDRRRFLRLAAGGATQTKIRAAVNSWTAERQVETPEARLPTRRTDRRSAPRHRGITHLHPDQLHIALYAGHPDSGRRAKRVEDKPVARAMLGGKMCAIAVVSSDQGIVLIVRAERPEMPDLKKTRDEEE